VLDHRPGILCPRQSPAQLAVDDPCFPQRRKRLMRAWPVTFGHLRQLRKLHTCLSQLGNEVLHAAQGALDSLHAVVRVNVIKSVEGLLEQPQVKLVAKRRHRVLESDVLAREILEVTSDVASPACSVHLACSEPVTSGCQQTIDPGEGPVQAPSIMLAAAAA
jgi:hypothetical protein